MDDNEKITDEDQLITMMSLKYGSMHKAYIAFIVEFGKKGCSSMSIIEQRLVMSYRDKNDLL